MDVPPLYEIRSNSRKFKLLLKKIKENTGAEGILRMEIQKLLLYLEELGIENQLASIIGKQLKHHGFKKFFLGYNSYKIFQKEGKIPEQLTEILCLGELFSIPILFMDDIMDSHNYRNSKPTPYNYFSKRYPGRGKEYTLFYSNIVLNYLIGELMSKRIDHSLKGALLKIYINCANKTYMSPIYEQGAMPREFSDVLEIYRKKSYYFTTYFMSQLGSVMGKGRIRKGSPLEKILLNLTYLLSIKNDLFDFFGDGRSALEDLMNHSNTFGLYIIRKLLDSNEDAEMILKQDKERILEIINSDESRKEVLRMAIQIRNSIEVFVKGSNDKWYGNYLLYADFLLKDLVDNLNYVQ